MKFPRLVASFALIGALGLALSCCGIYQAKVVNSYIVSSNKGDLALFSFNDMSLSVEWRITDAGTGTIQKTLSLTATCASADATYGSRDCAVTGGACIDGTALCAPGDVPANGAIFRTTQAEGVGLLALTPGADQLFIGLAAGGCDANTSGTYLGMNLGVNQPNLFMLYQPDSSFTQVAHADFRVTGGANVTSPTFQYDGTGTSPTTLSFVGSACRAGLRTFTIDGNGYSATLSQSGTFVLDKPAGQGGVVAFRTADAAALSDIAGRTFRGFSFPDNGAGKRLALTTGIAATEEVPLTAIQFDDGSTLTTLPAIRRVDAAGSPFTNPAATPTALAGGADYTANGLSASYANIASIPGLYYLPPDTGSHAYALIGALKQNAKTLLFGVFLDDRSTAPGGLTSYPTATAFPNTGVFLAFEQ